MKIYVCIYFIIEKVMWELIFIREIVVFNRYLSFFVNNILFECNLCLFFCMF